MTETAKSAPWTTKPPTTPGLYWYRELDVHPYVRHIIRLDGRLYVVGPWGRDTDTPLEQLHGEWLHGFISEYST